MSEKARGAGGRQSGSFDELFGGVHEQHIDSSRPKHLQPNLAPIAQNPREDDSSQPPNTYDDFMDRIFRET